MRSACQIYLSYSKEGWPPQASVSELSKNPLSFCQVVQHFFCSGKLKYCYVHQFLSPIALQWRQVQVFGSASLAHVRMMSSIALSCVHTLLVEQNTGAAVFRVDELR